MCVVKHADSSLQSVAASGLGVYIVLMVLNVIVLVWEVRGVKNPVALVIIESVINFILVRCGFRSLNCSDSLARES